MAETPTPEEFIEFAKKVERDGMREVAGILGIDTSGITDDTDAGPDNPMWGDIARKLGFEEI